MRKIFKGVLILVGLSIVLVMMPGPQATADDANTFQFVYESPHFTLTVPEGIKSRATRNPDSVLRIAYDMEEILTLEVGVSKLPAGYSFKKNAVIGHTDFLEDKYGATGVETLYEREITLKDGTPAYEFELKWKHPAILLYTYKVIAIKDNKLVYVSVTNREQIIDKYKQTPLSLTFK